MCAQNARTLHHCFLTLPKLLASRASQEEDDETGDATPCGETTNNRDATATGKSFKCI